MTSKTYLGDSVYAAPDPGGIVITTENGYGPSNEIFLEYPVYKALIAFGDSVFRKAMAYELPREDRDDS